jgi:hypothetical protein
LVKKWSQDPLFVVTRSWFLSILIQFSENSIGHVFHLFELIFSVVTSFVLLSKVKYQKNKIKKSKFSKKNNDSPKNRKKRGAKEEQYLEEHIEDTKVSCVSVCCLVPCLCCCLHPPYLFFSHLSPCYPPYFCHTPVLATL